MKNFIAILLFSLISVGTQAQETKTEVKKTQTVTFLTSAICGSCKKRIEKEMNYAKGVIYSELDLETKMLTVKFKTKFLDEAKVKKLVSDIGYKAGDVEPNKEAYNNLPACCQKPGLCSD